MEGRQAFGREGGVAGLVCGWGRAAAAAAVRAEDRGDTLTVTLFKQKATVQVPPPPPVEGGCWCDV
jgi:hypothetical protein